MNAWQTHVQTTFAAMQLQTPKTDQTTKDHWLAQVKESGAPQSALPMLTEGVVTYAFSLGNQDDVAESGGVARKDSEPVSEAD